jgi:ABC-2 type transport system ATP-binding protein
MKALPDIEDVEIDLPGDGEWTHAKIFAKPGVDVRENVYGVVRQNNWPLRELSRVKATLEEAFVELTQD